MLNLWEFQHFYYNTDINKNYKFIPNITLNIYVFQRIKRKLKLKQKILKIKYYFK